MMDFRCATNQPPIGLTSTLPHLPLLTPPTATASAATVAEPTNATDGLSYIIPPAPTPLGRCDN